MRSYPMFLELLLEQLQESVRQAENAGWHHEAAGTPTRFHYDRVCTWLAEIEERLRWWEDRGR